MKKSRILLSALLAALLSADAFAYEGIVTGGKSGTPGDPNSKSSYSGIDFHSYTRSRAHIEIKSGNAQHSYSRIYGGYDLFTMNVQNNTITMSGGSVYHLYGGFSSAQKVNNNSIIMSGGSAKDLYGGYSRGSFADSNSITMSGGSANDL